MHPEGSHICNMFGREHGVLDVLREAEGMVPTLTTIPCLSDSLVINHRMHAQGFVKTRLGAMVDNAFKGSA